MCMSGVMIGKAIIAVVFRPIPRDRPQALTARFAAAVGTVVRGTAALLLATATRPTAAAATLGSALFSPSNNFVHKGLPLSQDTPHLTHTLSLRFA